MELGPNQKQWVADLRSGESDQCTGELYMEGAYCALGMVDRAHVRDNPCGYFHVEDKVALAVSRIVWLWNDRDEKTFPEIADLIEEHADKLFSEPR